jgi:outer membrane biosynthesis protein TonB
LQKLRKVKFNFLNDINYTHRLNHRSLFMQDSIANAEVTTTAAPAAPATPAVAPVVASKPAVKTAVKPATKAAIKPVAKKPEVTAKPKTKAKVAAKPAAKPAAKTEAKPAAKAVAKPAVKATAKPEAKPAAKAVAKPAKEKKIKMVRDSISIPKTEYVVLDDLKIRAGKLAVHVKKTELIRAGIKALAALGDAGFVAALRAVPSLKTGRPSKSV